MSLIEQALEKMRAQKQSTGAPAPAVAAPRIAAPLPAASAPWIAPATPAAVHSLHVNIDKDKLLREGVLAKLAQQHQQASEYRQIKRQLLQALREGGTASKDSDRAR